ncbi:hypothetical protein GJ744_002428 [Endocarpon pusillum]|uniref:Uncharacterized protein n=1 Tax=Endocarpon pusillum TaxID=364733 RepID=A0A8H7E2Q7_9EURO|nr:hypothetical protein GJ744_002428 [Endocarpon pusillum]
MFHFDRRQPVKKLSGRLLVRATGSTTLKHGITYPTMSTACMTLNSAQGPWLNDSELDDWLMQRGRFEHPEAPGNGEKPSGGFRLLLCKRPWQSPPALQMSYAGE